MLQTLKKFFAFCGKENRKMFVASIWLGAVSAICSAMRIPAAAIVIQALLTKNVTMATLWTSLGIIVASLIVTIAINMKATMLQTRAGYRACANKRIEIAEHLRYLPMGWFNDNSLGEVTSVTTNTMENMANVATRVVMVTTRGFLTSGIIAVMMFLFDWRMGLITLAGLVLFFAVNAAMQRAEQTLAQRKFSADERLVSKVLEYVQGIAEVKNNDLIHDSATQVHGAVEEARRASFAMEIPSVLYMLAQFIVNKLTGVAVCTAAIVFYFGGTMELMNCLLMLICSFILFEQLDSAGSFSSLFRSIDIGVDKANAILNVEPMDIDGEDLTPEREDIELHHVDFSYDSKPILHDVSLTIPEKTTAAIVGPWASLYTSSQIPPGFCFQCLPHRVGCAMLIEKFIEIPIQCAHFIDGIHGMVRGAELAQRGRTHQFEKVETGPAILFALKACVRLWQNGVSRISYCTVALYVGIQQTVQVRGVSLELFQVAVRLIAGKSRRHHKRRVAEQVVLHVRLVDDIVFRAAENFLNQPRVRNPARQLSNGDFL